MAAAKLTLIGIDSYMKILNKSVFDLLELPTGYNKEQVVNNILLNNGEFEVLYANGDFLREAVGIWSKKWYKTFDKWLTALNIEYSPLENYDRIEDFTDNSTSTGTTALNTSGTDGSTTEQKKSAFDSSDYSPDAKATTDNTNSQTSNGTTNGTTNTTRSGRTHGNIGVTTSQQMLQAELDIAKWNLYDNIADIFKSELCIAVYE